MNPIIVCYHTGEDLYREGAERLAHSAQINGYETYIEEVENRGSWEANCAFKPSFLLKCAKEIASPLIWIDADGEVIRRMEGLDNPPFDFGVSWNPLNKFKCFNSGTLYFNTHDSKTISFLEEWAKDCSSDLEGKTKKTDQVILYETWKRVTNIPITQILPQGYAKVFDHGWRLEEDTVEYVRHHQASRTIRKQYA